MFFFFKHKTSYEMRISDWSSDVCSSDLRALSKILEAGVRGANSFDDKAIATFLRKNRVETIHGRLRFDGPGNYGDDLMKIKQEIGRASCRERVCQYV